MTTYYNHILNREYLYCVESLFSIDKEENVYLDVVRRLEKEKMEIENYLILNATTLKSQRLVEFVEMNCDELNSLYDYNEFENCVDCDCADEEVLPHLECKYCKLHNLKDLIQDNKNIKIIK